MNRARLAAFVLTLMLLPGCASIESAWKSATGASVEKTLDAPIARVKPAFISTLSQMGMPIAAMEVRGKIESIKARKAGRSVEVEMERLSAHATRARVTGSDDATAAEVMRETERRLRSG
jgi:PBP1b-binding outer membrane lipoprotein LpoB